MNGLIEIISKMDELKKIFIAISESCDIVNNCMNDDNYLCEILCSLDREFLQNYYNSDKSGPIVDIRKKICEEVLLGRKLTSDKLNDIINTTKSLNQKAFKSWGGNFSILNALVINKFNVDIDKLIIGLSQLFESEVKTKVWDFKGSRNHGQNHYCLLFYNKTQESHSTSLQIFIDFEVNNRIKYGVWKESSKEYIMGPFYCDINESENIFNFIEENKKIILDDNSTQISNNQMNFIEAAKFILNEFENKPMTSKEIWNEIDSRNLVKTVGKTPWASMNTILLSDCVDSPVTGNKTRNIFRIVEKSPSKFILNNYMSKNIKETMTQNGFITIDMLREIFEKNGLELKI